MDKLLITNARLVNEGETKDADVLIVGERIEKIGTGLSADDVATVIDAGGKILMPGMINTHTHASMTMFRGLGDDVPDRLRRYIFPLEAMVRAAFDCAQRLFGLTFTPRDDTGTYHPDVRAYEVSDHEGVPSFVLPGMSQTSFAFRLPRRGSLEFESGLPGWSAASGGKGTLRVAFDSTDGVRRDTVEVPELPGCVTEGDSLAEAKRMAKDAIELWLSVAEPHKAKASRAR